MNCCARMGAFVLCVLRHGTTAVAEGQAYYTRPPPHNPRRSPRFRVIQVQDLDVCMELVLVLVAAVEVCVQYARAMMRQYVVGVFGGEIPMRNQRDEYRRGVRLGMEGQRGRSRLYVPKSR